MKKGLLYMVGASLIASSAIAQDAEPDRSVDTLWMNSGLDEAYSVWLDMSSRTPGLKDLITTETAAQWKAASATQDVITVEDNLLTIEHTQAAAGAYYQDINFQTTGWAKGGEYPFEHVAEKAGEVVDTMYGMFVDMGLDGQVVVSFTAKTDKDCQVRLDIVDANGRQGNGKSASDYQNTQRVDLTADGGWTTVNFQWDYVLYDYYSGAYWGNSTGMWDKVGIVVDGKRQGTDFAADGTYLWVDRDGEVFKHEIAQENVIPVDNRSICKLMFIIDDAEQGTVGETKTVQIKDLVIGKVSEAVSYIPTEAGLADGTITYDPSNALKVRAHNTEYSDAVDDASGVYTDATSAAEAEATATVYPNPATDVINVEGAATVATLAGTVVAEGVDTVDVSALSAGTYVVTTAAGSTLVVVE